MLLANNFYNFLFLVLFRNVSVMIDTIFDSYIF